MYYVGKQIQIVSGGGQRSPDITLGQQRSISENLNGCLIIDYTNFTFIVKVKTSYNRVFHARKNFDTFCHTEHKIPVAVLLVTTPF